MSLQPSRPLRVAALVKQIPAFESAALGPDGRLVRQGLALHMNDYCRRAVAKGYELARASGGSLTVITLGPPSAEDVLREAIAFGADEGIHVTDPAFAGSDSLATARALASTIQLVGPFDLVLLGRNSVDADTGQVPPQVATLLGLPFVAGVRELDLDGDLLGVRLEHDDEWVEAEVALPAIVSAAERLCDPCKIKNPSVWAGVDAAKIRRLTAADLSSAPLGAGPWGQAGSPTSVGAVRSVGIARTQHVVAPGPVAEQVAEVMRVLDERGALSTDITGSTVTLPAAGTPGGPEIVVTIEPNRPGITRELLGAAAKLAASIGGRVVAIATDVQDGPALASTLGAQGADELMVLDGLAAEEDVAATLAEVFRMRTPWAVVGPSTEWGREVLARAALSLGAGLVGDAVDLEARDGKLVAAKPAFGGSLVADIHYASPTQFATVRAGVFPKPEPRPSGGIPVTTLTGTASSRIKVLSRKREDDIDDLATATRVIGVGVGVAHEDYPLMRQLAEQAGLTLSATRRVTDKGWLPRARQVGITGHSIAPNLFVSVGASGKYNHTAGIQAAGTVVAINNDPQAPVFGHADIGIVGDWREVLPVLAAALQSTTADRSLRR